MEQSNTSTNSKWILPRPQNHQKEQNSQRGKFKIPNQFTEKKKRINKPHQ